MLACFGRLQLKLAVVLCLLKKSLFYREFKHVIHGGELRVLLAKLTREGHGDYDLKGTGKTKKKKANLPRMGSNHRPFG